MTKNGQISYFLIFGLLILMLSFFFVTFFQREPEKITFDNDIESVNSFVSDCLDDTLSDAVNRLGDNGGFIYGGRDLKIQYTQKFLYSYLYIDRTKRPLDQKMMERDIGRYINDNLRYCIRDFGSYDSYGYMVFITDPETNVTIAENEVYAFTSFPVRMKKHDTIEELSKFYAKKSVSLPKIIREVNGILDESDTMQREIDLAISENRYPDVSIPPNQYTKDGLEFNNYRYDEDRGRALWVISDKGFDFAFAVRVLTE